MHLAQELLMNVQCSGGSRSFAKEMRALKMRRVVASHQKLTMTNWEDNWSWSSYNCTRSCPRTQQTILWSFGSWSKLETWKWKSLISGCLMSWQQIKKKSFKCCLLLLYATTTNHFSIGLWRDKKWNLYNNWPWPAQWLNQKEAPKHFPKPNLHQRKGHGHYVVVC